MGRLGEAVEGPEDFFAVFEVDAGAVVGDADAAVGTDLDADVDLGAAMGHGIVHEISNCAGERGGVALYFDGPVRADKLYIAAGIDREGGEIGRYLGGDVSEIDGFKAIRRHRHAVQVEQFVGHAAETGGVALKLALVRTIGEGFEARLQDGDGRAQFVRSVGEEAPLPGDAAVEPVEGLIEGADEQIGRASCRERVLVVV